MLLHYETSVNINLFQCVNVQQYFSYIMAVSFIGGGNRMTRRKPLTCRKSLTEANDKFILITKKTIQIKMTF